MRASRDVIVGTAVLAIAAVYYVFTRDIQDSFLSDAIGPRGLPSAYAAVLAVLGVVLIAQALLRRAPAQRADRAALAADLRALGLVALGALYLAVITWLGYLGAVFLLLFAVAWYAGARPGLKLAGLAAVGAVFLWLSFAKLFALNLPTGTLWSSLLH